MKYIVVFIILITSCSLKNNNPILGEWRCTKRVLFDPANREFSDTLMVLKFNSKGKVQVFVGDEENENIYSISGDTLIIDQDKYIIKKLDKNSLIIRQIVGFPIEKELYFKRENTAK